MPIDNVKTRMQSLGAGAKYRNSLDCLVSIVRHEGVQRLWSGTTPRLARLMVSNSGQRGTLLTVPAQWRHRVLGVRDAHGRHAGTVSCKLQAVRWGARRNKMSKTRADAMPMTWAGGLCRNN